MISKHIGYIPAQNCEKNLKNHAVMWMSAKIVWSNNRQLQFDQFEG